MLIGISLGALIALVSSVVFVCILKELASFPNKIRLIAEVLSLPSFWFGSPWAASKFMKHIQWQDIVTPYLLTLTSCMFLFSFLTFFCYIKKTNRDILKR